MNIHQDPKTRPMDRLRTRYVLIGICIGLFLGVVFVNSAYAQIEKPKQQWWTAIEYYTHDTCAATSVYPVIDRVASETAQYSVPIKKLGTYNSFDRDGKNTIGCASSSPFQNALMIAEEGIEYIDYDFSAAGTARVWSYTATGQIVEFDIWLDSFWMFSGTVALRTIRHEWGHALGLPHTLNEKSLMFATATTQYWDAETIAKLSFLYNKCDTQFDEGDNLWLPKVLYRGDYYYGILPNGGRNPSDFQQYGKSECK